MKEYVLKIQSLLLFDFPSKTFAIRESFLTAHGSYQQQFPHWPLAATRRKLIAQFWFREVALHFLLVLSVACLLVLPVNGQWKSAAPAMLFAGLISFVVITFRIYAPAFYADFLPMLDNIVAEQAKDLATKTEIKKCKRTQYSIPTLTIIFYVFCNAGGMGLPATNDQSAQRLNNLFGSDKDKLKQNLSRLYKIAGLSPKERAEMFKGIETARTFFEGFGFDPAQKILDILELKLQKTS